MPADPQIAEALKTRDPRDVLVMSCPVCHELSYYNEGSHFSCAHCGRGFDALTEDEIVERMEDWNASSRPYVVCDEAMSIADCWEAELCEGGAEP